MEFFHKHRITFQVFTDMSLAFIDPFFPAIYEVLILDCISVVTGCIRQRVAVRHIVRIVLPGKNRVLYASVFQNHSSRYWNIYGTDQDVLCTSSNCPDLNYEGMPKTPFGVWFAAFRMHDAPTVDFSGTYATTSLLQTIEDVVCGCKTLSFYLATKSWNQQTDSRYDSVDVYINDMMLASFYSSYNITDYRQYSFR